MEDDLICCACGKPCSIYRQDESFWDDAYGSPRWIEAHVYLSSCCAADIAFEESPTEPLDDSTLARLY